MNRLTGRLLHACFEQGPFPQRDLVRACLAWPQLARFWLTCNNRASGYGTISFPGGYNPEHDLKTQFRTILGPSGKTLNHGLQWGLICRSPVKTVLTLCINDWKVFRGVAGSLNFVVKGVETPHDYESWGLQDCLDWVLTLSSKTYFMCHVFQDSSGNSFGRNLKEFLDNPCEHCSSIDPDALARVIGILRETTPEQSPVFEALAQICCKNRAQVPEGTSDLNEPVDSQALACLL